ncbi:hypothetical protein TNCV_1199131 [Trichonephila clavipes]|uniref:Uncharacterized protein n=1 Tax=Trichonephila clavipes TaxID=2585209 RepID=A0A8X6S3Y0_TRICX|nr:hypothetical protein TNCV_1199131 [Trichonephila clavipes]
MHLIYGLAEGNARSTEIMHCERYLPREDHLMSDNLHHNLCEYGSLRNNRYSKGGRRVTRAPNIGSHNTVFRIKKNVVPLSVANSKFQFFPMNHQM